MFWRTLLLSCLTFRPELHIFPSPKYLSRSTLPSSVASSVNMVYETPASQSVVARTLATQRHGILGMLQNPYVFLTCLFASLGCMMYGYEYVVHAHPCRLPVCTDLQ